MQIQDLNLALIVIGTIVTFVYLMANQPYRHREKGEDPVRRTNFVGVHIPEPKNLFVLQYEQINQNLRLREIATVVSGSLFLATSILLLCSSAILQEGLSTVVTYALAFSSVILYSIWLLAFNLPANVANNRDLFQMSQMENETENGLTVHISSWQNMNETTWKKYFKRQGWIYPFWVLVAAAVAIVYGSIN